MIDSRFGSFDERIDVYCVSRRTTFSRFVSLALPVAHKPKHCNVKTSASGSLSGRYGNDRMIPIVSICLAVMATFTQPPLGF